MSSQENSETEIVLSGGIIEELSRAELLIANDVFARNLAVRAIAQQAGRELEGLSGSGIEKASLDERIPGYRPYEWFEAYARLMGFESGLAQQAWGNLSNNSLHRLTLYAGLEGQPEYVVQAAEEEKQKLEAAGISIMKVESRTHDALAWYSEFQSPEGWKPLEVFRVTDGALSRQLNGAAVRAIIDGGGYGDLRGIGNVSIPLLDLYANHTLRDFENTTA